MKDAELRDFSVNTLSLQLFPEPMLIDPLGHGEDDVHEKTLRPACSANFALDLGAQFRFWKFVNEAYTIFKIEGESISLGVTVDQLICDRARKLEAEVENLQKDKYEEHLHFYFATLRSNLFEDRQEMPAKVSEMHMNMKEKGWWKSTIALARSEAAAKLFNLLRSPSIYKVLPSLDTIVLVSLIANLETKEEGNDHEMPNTSNEGSTEEEEAEEEEHSKETELKEKERD